MKLTKSVAVKLILILLLIPAIVVSASYAWVAFIERTQPILIYSGKIEVEASFYQADDPNFDGIFDDYLEINEAGVTFEHAAPGQIFSFKLTINNQGNIPARLTVTLLNHILNNPDLAELFHLEFLHPGTNQVIQMTLLGNQVILFDDYILPRETIIDLLFTITIDPYVGNSFALETIELTQIDIRLDQIQP